jgi:2-succinyl-6-hydroxy-2,4-cyclohexadiene-1-carboxylate synthase
VRLVLVHGFTQTGRSWGPVAEEFAGRGYDVACPDLPGHGVNADVRADLAQSAAGLAAESATTAATQPARPRPPIWVGYSLGGRVCLRLDPSAVSGLVLVSTTAGIEDDAERRRRQLADDALADDIEAMGTGPFIERWLQGPLWATLSREAAGIEHRLANSPEGLASSLRLAGTGVQLPIWDRLADLDVPVLVVTGDRDEKFTALGDRLAAAIGRNATRARQPDAGHAVPWEQPSAFVDLVDGWIRAHWQSPGRP